MIIKIPVSDTTKILIKENQNVDFETPLFKTADKKDIKIHISQELDISPSKIFISMKKAVGEEVNRGDILAVKKGLFSEKKYICDFEGIIKEINHEDGSVIIASLHQKAKEINSFFKGMVKKIQQDNIEIEVKNYVKFDIKEVNESFGGETYFINKKSASDLKENDVKNKILVIKKIEPYNQVRFEVLGARGYITVESLDHPVDIFHAQLQKETDLNTITNSNFQFCTIVKEDHLLYLYK